jgi:glycosyltransferase involved in cell wall biosynthesis
MNIAWIVPGSPYQLTGGYVYNTLIAKCLAASGHHVTWVSVPEARLAWAPADRELDPGDTLLALLPQLVQADVVVGDELAWGEVATLFMYLRAQKPNARCMLLVHHLGSWEGSGGNAALAASELTVVRSATATACTSMHSATRLAAAVGTPIAALEPGADRLGSRATYIRPHAAKTPHFLAVGTVTPRKRVIELVRIFAQSGRGTLTIVGSLTRDPAYARDVRAAASAVTSAKSQVVFAGEVTDAELHALYTSADALLHCAEYEGYGMVLTEALWAGVPVLATTGGAVADVLGSGKHAQVVELADFGRALAAWDDAVLAERAEAAWRRGEGLPTWSTSALQFAEWLRTG